MSTEIIETRSPEEVAEDAVLATIKAFIIVTNDDRMLIEEWIQKLSAAEKRRIAHYKPSRDKAWDDYQYHLGRLNNAVDPFVDARKTAKQKCISWDQAQERIRQEAQRKAEEEARKRAEEEALAAAAQAEAEGDHEAADAIISEPIQIAPVIVPRTAFAPSRLSAGRTTWYAVVTDIKKLCAAIGAGVQPTEYAIGLVRNKETGDISSPTLNTFATRLQSTMAIPGVLAKSRIG